MAGAILAEEIANQLRRDILRGKLAPGDTVKERHTAAELGVSRTPMREAIRILAKEGLVVLRPSRSPVVADPSLEEVTHAIEVLRALELLGARLACERASARQIAGIEALHRKMCDMYTGQPDMLDVFEADMAFHKAIVQAAGNPMLSETHGAYLARLWRARYLSASQRRSRERVLRQHGAITDALRARDSEAIRRELDGHLEHLVINIAHFFETREEQPPGASERAAAKTGTEDP